MLLFGTLALTGDPQVLLGVLRPAVLVSPQDGGACFDHELLILTRALAMLGGVCVFPVLSLHERRIMNFHYPQEAPEEGSFVFKGTLVCPGDAQGQVWSAHLHASVSYSLLTRLYAIPKPHAQPMLQQLCVHRRTSCRQTPSCGQRSPLCKHMLARRTLSRSWESCVRRRIHFSRLRRPAAEVKLPLQHAYQPCAKPCNCKYFLV